MDLKKSFSWFGRLLITAADVYVKYKTGGAVSVKSILEKEKEVEK